MKRVTRNIDPSCARDLLERVPRACICFACEHGPQVQPVVFVWHDDRYLVGLPLDIKYQPGSDQEAVLFIDEGVYYFDLRAISIRGRVKQATPPKDSPTRLLWFEVVPFKTVAWDYGTLREVRDEH